MFHAIGVETGIDLGKMNRVVDELESLEGKVCAALSIAGPINRFSKEHNVKHLKVLLASAERLSRMLGYECTFSSTANTLGTG